MGFILPGIVGMFELSKMNALFPCHKDAHYVYFSEPSVKLKNTSPGPEFTIIFVIQLSAILKFLSTLPNFNVVC